jgi:hypothetical protein
VRALDFLFQCSGTFISAEPKPVEYFGRHFSPFYSDNC